MWSTWNPVFFEIPRDFPPNVEISRKDRPLGWIKSFLNNLRIYTYIFIATDVFQTSWKIRCKLTGLPPTLLNNNNCKTPAPPRKSVSRFQKCNWPCINRVSLFISARFTILFNAITRPASSNNRFTTFPFSTRPPSKPILVAHYFHRPGMDERNTRKKGRKINPPLNITYPTTIKSYDRDLTVPPTERTVSRCDTFTILRACVCANTRRERDRGEGGEESER